MAEVKICDRPHHVAIPKDSEYYALSLKTPEGETKIDLCQQCGLEFKAFMNTVTAQPTVNPAPDANQAQPAQ